MSTNSLLSTLSSELADRVAAASAVTVQVAGSRRPATGVVHRDGTILTTTRAIGREEGLRVRLPDGTAVDADLAGWDPAAGIALLRPRTSLARQPPPVADVTPTPGALVLTVARSWSNAVTASAGIVAVVGGPLRTGRRRQLAEVIRITAPMHEGFAGAGVFDASGRLAGIATAGEIRGFGVVIPAAIATASANQILASGTPRRGFLGVAVQPVQPAPSQVSDGRGRALLVAGVTPGSPAAAAGILVGDLLLDVDGRAMEVPEDLLDALSGRAGATVSARVLRGDAVRDVQIAVAARP